MNAPSNLRLASVRRGAPLTFTWNKRPIHAFAGETIAAALLAHGVTALRRTAQGEPRGVFCGMGACFECRVTVDGRASARACLTLATEGMAVTAQIEAATLNLEPHAKGARRG